MTDTTAATDITFAEPDGAKLKLNVYRADVDRAVPAVVYLHGGGWQFGDRYTDEASRGLPAAARGLGVVAIDYRLAPDSTYPAQIHDVRAAVRWIRANGSEHGLRTDRVGVWGSSAGAMLGSLAALSSEPGGKAGGVADPSSAVEAVAHWCGPTDFVTTATRSPLEGRLLPPPVENVFLGLGGDDKPAAIAPEASPISHVSADAPPFLIVHGDRDRLTPLADAEAFHAALSRAGADSTLVTLAGAGHDDTAFDSAATLGMTVSFLLAHLSAD